MNQGAMCAAAISSLHLDQRKVNWIVIGVALGYPTCCIKEFLDLQHLGKPDRKLDGTGYVPCEHCDSTKTISELVDTINRARSKDIPLFSHVVADHHEHR